MNATTQDISLLDQLYNHRDPYHGQLHDHASTGGRSDGKCTLTQWKEGMEALSLDFTTILDHRQVRHMHLPEWDETMFIGGTEPGTTIKDSKAEVPKMHYLMIFAKHEQLEALLTEFEEYEFGGAPDGEYRYRHFTVERFGLLIDAIRRLGGMFVHPHPKQVMVSDDPLDYWFRDDTGLEVFYTCHEDLDGDQTAANYKLWTDLLALGKRVWACCSNDEHRNASHKAIVTVYAEERLNVSYMEHLRIGDFVCGGVGIRMCIGDIPMGGHGDFAGKRLVFSVGDFHKSYSDPTHTYRMDLLDDTGVIFSSKVDPAQKVYFARDVDNSRKFYRVEIFDETRNVRIAIGNPIWNTNIEEAK